MDSTIGDAWAARGIGFCGRGDAAKSADSSCGSAAWPFDVIWIYVKCFLGSRRRPAEPLLSDGMVYGIVIVLTIIIICQVSAVLQTLG